MEETKESQYQTLQLLYQLDEAFPASHALRPHLNIVLSKCPTKNE